MKFAGINIVTLQCRCGRIIGEGELGPSWSDRIALR